MSEKGVGTPFSLSECKSHAAPVNRDGNSNDLMGFNILSGLFGVNSMISFANSSFFS